MDANQRLKLQEMITENNVVDNTQLIRMFKHSDKIRVDVERMSDLHREHGDDDNLLEICQRECNFLYNSYTDIFNRLMKHELDTSMLDKVLLTLKKIEDSELDQHEASFEVGTLLKKMYVDSAMKRQKKREEQDKKVDKKKKKAYTWNEFKAKKL